MLTLKKRPPEPQQPFVDSRDKEWMKFAKDSGDNRIRYTKKTSRADWPRFVIHNYRGV